MPALGDRVEIAKGTEVILDVNPPALNGLTIHGKLIFADESDLTLSTEWVEVHGELQIGTPAIPFTHKATIILTDNVRNEWRGDLGDRGILVSGGTLNLHGNRSNTWTRLARTAEAGSNAIEVLDAAQWQVGDEIVLASTDYEPRQAERRTISAISGNTLTLDQKLQYMHLGEITAGVDERGEVGLLTRNIRIQASEDAARSFFGGHILAKAGGRIHVDGVELDRMGQNRALERYPIYWRLVGDATGQYIRNAAIHDSYNRCVTVHGTNALHVENNVTYNTVGHCFVLEDGVEHSNHFVRNLAIQTKCHTSKPCDLAALPGETAIALDNTASSFWISNLDNIYIGNVAAGSDATGFWFAFPVQPTGASASPAKLRQFGRNVAHSSFAGFMHGRAGRVPQGDGRMVVGDHIVFADRAVSKDTPVDRLVDDFTSYKNRNGGFWARSEVSHPMNRIAGGGWEVSSYDAPYWVTITIPKSRDTFQNHAISDSSRFGVAGRRVLAKFAFTPPGGGPPDTSVTLFMYDRYKGNASSPLPVNPSLQEFVAEYNARHAHFHPDLNFPQVEVADVSALRLGDRTWLKVTNWSHIPDWVHYVTIIDEKKMLVLDWNQPRDTFFKRNRAAKKWPEIESMLASVRLSKDP